MSHAIGDKLDPRQTFFEQLAQKWDSNQPTDREDTLHQLLAPFDPHLQQCQSLLDVGTGTGAIIPVLKLRYPAASIYSIDLAHKMLVRAHQRIASANLIQADVHQLPFVRNCFSAILCHNSFPHFQDKAWSLLEMKRVLQRGGWLFIVHDLSREKVNTVHKNAVADCIHLDILPSGEEVGRLLEAVGFRTCQIQDSDIKYSVSAQTKF
jgi:ubiquinone/menaquinone biosynthesis C-methylase UbiE